MTSPKGYNNQHLLDRSSDNELYVAHIDACLQASKVSELIDLATIDFSQPPYLLRKLIFSRMKDAGFTYKRIGEIVDLSGDRIAKLVEQHRRYLIRQEAYADAKLSSVVECKDIDDELSVAARKRQMETDLIERMSLNVFDHKPQMCDWPVMMSPSTAGRLYACALSWYDQGASITQLVKAFSWMYRLFDLKQNIDQSYCANTLHQARKWERLVAIIQKEFDVPREWALMVTTVLQNVWSARSIR